MYFYKRRGKQTLDLRGDLILTHNHSLAIGRIKSAAPSAVRNAKYIQGIYNMGLFRKIKATLAAIRFIWGENQALTEETIESEGL